MKKLKTSIEMAGPGVDVVCRVGRRTSFEVVVDGALIHSKLRVGKLPDFDQTVEIIKTVVDGAEPEKVSKLQHSCNIL